MKKILWLCMSLLLCILLTGCGTAKECEHLWSEADCLQASRCSHCGEIRGEALGHDWLAAACESPERCSRCGETRGEAADHLWLAANCESPECCSRCGETRGDPGEHRYGSWMLGSEDMYRLCAECENRDSREIDYALFLNETLPGHWNLCYRIRSGSVQRLFSTTPPSPDPEIIFRPDGSVLTGGSEPKDTGEVWEFDRGEVNSTTGQHDLYFRIGAADELCLSCLDGSILCTVSDSKGDSLILAKAQGQTLAPLLAGEWAAYSVDTVYTIRLAEDRSFTADFDGEIRGFWQPRPLESTGSHFYNAEVLLNYVKDGEEKTVSAFLNGIDLQLSRPLQKRSLSFTADINDTRMVFNPDAGESLRDMAAKADTALLGEWTSVDYILSFAGKFSNGEYTPGEEVRGLSTEYSITFMEDGSYRAGLHEEIEGTWTLSRITTDGELTSWCYTLTGPGMTDASNFQVSSGGHGYLYIHNEHSNSCHYTFKQMDPETLTLRNERIEKAPTMVLRAWYAADNTDAEAAFREDGSFCLTNGGKAYEGLWHFNTMSEGGEDVFYYFYDLETDYETFYKAIFGEDYDISAMVEELPKDEETGEPELYREANALLLTEKNGRCTFDLTSYMGTLHMMDADSFAENNDAASELAGHWSADTARVYDKAAEESSEVPGDYFLSITGDGSFTGHIGKPVQGTWSYMDTENGTPRFLFSFEGHELASLFTLKDGVLSGPCTPYLVDLYP